MISEVDLTYNLSVIQSKIAIATKESHRKKSDINIVAVAKTFSQQAWNIAVHNKLCLIGENKIQETEKKLIKFNYKNKIKLHFIGHLQSNKVVKAVKMFDIIETVDSMKIIKKINSTAKRYNKIQKLYLQVNLTKEPQKFGLSKNEIIQIANKSMELNNVSLEGIMTIPPNNLSEKEVRKIFSKTRDIKDIIYNSITKKCKFLSMGMSSDYELAIKEGATHIRIGTLLFGPRKKC